MSRQVENEVDAVWGKSEVCFSPRCQPEKNRQSTSSELPMWIGTMASRIDEFQR
jgi:hypothetical protein